MTTTNATLVNFYIASQLAAGSPMEGIVAQVKLFNSRDELAGAGWHKMRWYDSTTTDESVISSFAALVDPEEYYYLEYNVCCKFLAQITGTIRLGDVEAHGFDSKSKVVQYTAANSGNLIDGAAIIANQTLPPLSFYGTALPNAIEVAFS